MSVPAWARRTAGEHRWPAALAIIVGIVIQLAQPSALVPGTRYLLPALEVLLLAGLLVANPFRMDRESAVLRWTGLGLAVLLVVSNAVSAGLLVRYLVSGAPTDPHGLLVMGGGVWATNVLAFALIFWELDRGGPAARAAAVREHPDFLFPQMTSPELAPEHWEPRFTDYLYTSFTNATAFGPTDVMPLTTRAKAAMTTQSGVALVVVALVVARAVNVLA